MKPRNAVGRGIELENDLLIEILHRHDLKSLVGKHSLRGGPNVGRKRK